MRAEGFHVQRVLDVADPRATDREVAALALGLDAVLVTADRDFALRSAFDPRKLSGIIVMKDLPDAKEKVMRRLVRTLRRDRLRGALVILDARSARLKR